LRYQAITLPRIVESLTQVCGIPSDRILVVSGGYSRAYDAEFYGIETHCVEHNSFDHTGLIDVIDRSIRADYWFALHDTCEAGPQFSNLSNKLDSEMEYISVSKAGWFNMGAFSHDFLMLESDYVLSLRNCDKVRAMFSERVYLRLASAGCYGSGEIKGLGFFDPYRTGTQRSHLYMPDLDLHKYQANWQALASNLALDP